MAELDETVLRDHVRRRLGQPLEPAALDRLTSWIHDQVSRHDQRGFVSPRAVDLVPAWARLGLAAALVVAISLLVVPIAGGPKTATPGATLPTTPTATPPAASQLPTLDPNVLQVLSLDDLQRVVANADAAPYAERIVVADVDIAPEREVPLCVPQACWVDGLVVGASPSIRVVQPTDDTDIVRPFIGNEVLRGPVIVRIQGANTVELIGRAPRSVGRVAWALPSFVIVVQGFVRTMDFNPAKFIVGPPYVVDAKLVAGLPVPCPTAPAVSPARLAEFGCGLAAWLAPTEVADPTTIIDSSNARPPDWVRVQNGAYDAFAVEPGGASGATTGSDPRRGFYLVFPLVRYNPNLCFDCGGGAVAILYARLDPVPIP